MDSSTDMKCENMGIHTEVSGFSGLGSDFEDVEVEPGKIDYKMNKLVQTPGSKVVTGAAAANN
jgi:hypothetical protein